MYRRIDDAHLDALLAQERRDGRFPDDAAAANQAKSRRAYVELHRQRGDVCAWAEKQVYLAVGGLLFGAAALGLDACPMEGFDAQVLDAELGLAARGLRAVALVAFFTVLLLVLIERFILFDAAGLVLMAAAFGWLLWVKRATPQT